VYEQDRTQNYDPERTILHTSLYRIATVNYKKNILTHKSRLKYEIKYDLYKIAQNIILMLLYEFCFDL